MTHVINLAEATAFSEVDVQKFKDFTTEETCNICGVRGFALTENILNAQLEDDELVFECRNCSDKVDDGLPKGVPYGTEPEYVFVLDTASVERFEIVGATPEQLSGLCFEMAERRVLKSQLPKDHPLQKVIQTELAIRLNMIQEKAKEIDSPELVVALERAVGILQLLNNVHPASALEKYGDLIALIRGVAKEGEEE